MSHNGVKKLHGPSRENLPGEVDGYYGEDAIVNKFKEVYQNIYNRNESDKDIATFTEIIEKLTSQKDKDLVKLINDSVVRKAASLMKNNKADVSGGFSSNAVKNGPVILYTKLAEIFRSWMNHGKVTLSILVVSLLLLIKGLKNSGSTDNYRLIAGTSIILKLFEWVILIIWGPSIRNDNHQFSFREGVGASQCTWMIQETLNYYMRGGSQPYLVTLDCSKAFPSCR